MVHCSGSDPKIAVRVPAYLKPFIVRNKAQALEFCQRPNPVRTEGVHIRSARSNSQISIFGGPHPFVRRECNERTAPDFLHTAYRIGLYGLLYEINIELIEPFDVAYCLIDSPCPIGIQPNFRVRTNHVP